MPTLKEAIGTFEHLSKLCEANGIHGSQELYKQYAAWLRELVERRKESEVIKCGECEHSEVGGCELYCIEWMRYTSYDGYCHRGRKRRTDD